MHNKHKMFYRINSMSPHLRTWIFIISGLGVLSVCIPGMGETSQTRPGAVQADTLNVRARPGTNYEVVAKLQRGDNVEIVSEAEGWYEIMAPPVAEAWCAARFLSTEGVVKEDGLRVRSGPGIVFSAYATLEKGTEVKRDGKVVNGWQPIKVPENTTAWVSREFVKAEVLEKAEDIEETEKAEASEDERADEELDKENEAGTEEAVIDKDDAGKEDEVEGEVPEDQQKEVDQSEEDERDDAGAAVRPEDAGDGVAKSVTEEESETAGEEAPAEKETSLTPEEEDALLREGVVIPLKERKVPFATHVLARVEGDVAYPKAYIRSSRINLKKWEYKTVRVHGEKVKYRGWSRPVFVLEGIERVLEERQD